MITLKKRKGLGKLNSQMREWMYQTLGYRAALGALDVAYPLMIKNARSKKGSARKKQVELLEFISKNASRSGQSLADTLKGRIPDDEYILIAAGEAGANLSEGMMRALQRLKSKQKQTQQILKVLGSFFFRFALLIGTTIVMGKMLFPPLTKIKPVEQWDDLPQSVYAISNNLEAILPGLVLAIAILTFLVVISLSKLPNGHVRDFLMRYVPPWSIHRQLTLMSVMDSFSTMSGLYPEQEIIQKLKKASTNEWLKSCVSRMEDRIRTGKGNPFLDNPLVTEDINDILVSMGEGDKTDFYAVSVEKLNDQIDKSMTKISEGVSTFTTLLLYTFIGLLAVSFFTVAMTAATY